MQSEILSRLKLNQEELSRLRLANVEKIISNHGLEESTRPKRKVEDLPLNLPIADHNDIYLQFNSLKNDYLKTGKTSKRVLDEFKKLENQVLQLQDPEFNTKDGPEEDDDLAEIKRKHAKEMLIIKNQKELLLQKLEIQKLIKYFSYYSSNREMGPGIDTASGAFGFTTLPEIGGSNNIVANLNPNNTDVKSTLVNTDTNYMLPLTKSLPQINNNVNRDTEMEFTIEKGLFGFM